MWCIHKVAQRINKYRKTPEQRARDKQMVERWKWPKLPRLTYRIWVKQLDGNYVLLRYKGYPVTAHSEEDAERKIKQIGVNLSICRILPERRTRG